MRLAVASIVLMLVLTGCKGDILPTIPGDAAPRADAGDAGELADAQGGRPDANTEPDGGRPDARATDAGQRADATPADGAEDAGESSDASDSDT